MNERIRELVAQCETKEIGYYFFDREKFAELIIRECTSVVEDAFLRREPASTYVYKINTHFGVK